ncbi:MAG: metal-dependent transcriptional regulator [Desulfuromonadales bacterium]|nr:metal-dependent transcriptional regulator [Desulfuromonadales bacterium]
MRLSEKAEEILEKMWVDIEEDGRTSVEMESLLPYGDQDSINELTSHALVEIKDGMVCFRPEGREEGRKTIRRHRLAERLMMDILYIKGDEAEEKACQFEHMLDKEVDAKLCTMLNHPTTCPHGKPIPPGECCEKARQSGDIGVVALTELKSGDKGEIAYVLTEDSKKMQKLMAIGVLPGNKIELLQSFPSYIFRVGYSEFAVDTAMAKEIFVKRD